MIENVERQRVLNGTARYAGRIRAFRSADQLATLADAA
jgi:hypothetical protein